MRFGALKFDLGEGLGGVLGVVFVDSWWIWLVFWGSFLALLGLHSPLLGPYWRPIGAPGVRVCGPSGPGGGGSQDPVERRAGPGAPRPGSVH